MQINYAECWYAGKNTTWAAQMQIAINTTGCTALYSNYIDCLHFHSYSDSYRYFECIHCRYGFSASTTIHFCEKNHMPLQESNSPIPPLGFVYMAVGSTANFTAFKFKVILNFCSFNLCFLLEFIIHYCFFLYTPENYTA